MCSMRLGPSLAVVVTLSLTLLIAGVIGLGVAIRHGVVALPDVNMHLGGLVIIAVTTGTSECPPYSPCPNLPGDYYAVWVFQKAALDRVSVSSRPMLIMPMKDRYDRSLYNDAGHTRRG